jgi:hypothetical protein
VECGQVGDADHIKNHVLETLLVRRREIHWLGDLAHCIMRQSGRVEYPSLRHLAVTVFTPIPFLILVMLTLRLDLANVCHLDNSSDCRRETLSLNALVLRMKKRKLFTVLAFTWFGAMFGIVVCGLLFGNWRHVQLTKTDLPAVVQPMELGAIATTRASEVLIVPHRMTDNSKSTVTIR